MNATLPPNTTTTNTAEKSFFSDMNSAVVSTELFCHVKPSLSFSFQTEHMVTFNIMYNASEHNYPTPQKFALENIVKTIEIAKECGYEVKNYYPTDEGGAAAEFNIKNRYFHVEFFDVDHASLFVDEPNQVSRGWDMLSNEILNKFQEEIAK